MLASSSHVTLPYEEFFSLLVQCYNAGYSVGHEATVEGTFIPLHSADLSSYHSEEVAEMLNALMPGAYYGQVYYDAIK
jgi:hypothetical protein